MIRLEITADTPQELRAQLMAFGVAAYDVAPNQPASEPEKPKATRTKKTETPAASAEGNQSAPPAAEPEKPQADSSATSATTTLSREEVQKKCMAYGQPTKGGPEALRQLFIEQGSPNGKWSEVPDANLAALNARLDDLLA